MNEEPKARAEQNLTRKVFSGMIWSLSQNAFAAVAAFSAVLILARLLTPSDFGVVALAWAIVSILVVIGDFGLTPALIRISKPSNSVVATAFWMHLGASMTLAILVLAGASLWLRWGDSDQLAHILMALAVILPLGSLRLIPFTSLSRAMKFRSIAMRQVIAQTAGIAVAVPIALNGFGPWALVAQYVAFALAEVIIFVVLFPWRPHFEFSVQEMKELAAFGIPASLNRLVIAAREHGTSIIIGIGLGAFALGLWSVSTQIAALLASSVNNAINAVALPAFSKVASDSTRLVRGFSRTVGMSAMFAVPALVGVAVVSDTAVPLIFGEQWLEAAPVAKLVALGFAVAAVQWVDQNFWWAIGKPKIELGLSVLGAVVTGMYLILAMPWGLMAVSGVVLVRSVVMLPLRVFLLKKYAGVPVSTYRQVGGAFTSGAALFAAVLGTQTLLIGVVNSQWMSLLLQIGSGILCYAVVTVVLQRKQAYSLIETLRGSS